MAKVGSTKYGPNGLYSESSFHKTGLSLAWCQYLANVANFSLSKSTWSSYKTVQNHLATCQRDFSIRFSFPMSSDQVLIFISWLMKRGLEASSINSYISGLRTIHLTKGIDLPALRPPIISAVIEGRAHIGTIRRRLENKPLRMPVTLSVLKLIKAMINKWEENDQMRLLVWTVCLICFFGGFRIHEILSKNSQTFDPAFTLLGRDIKIGKFKTKGGMISTLQIKIKSPKEDRIGKEIVVDVYETRGQFCPVKYFRKWKENGAAVSCNKPAFTQPNGFPLTGKKLNEILKRLLSPHINYKKTKITTHSFRGGMATLLGQLGFSDEEIQAMGRWSSRAFEEYLKMPRTKRATMAKKMAEFCSQ